MDSLPRSIGGEFEVSPDMLSRGIGAKLARCMFSSGRSAFRGILRHASARGFSEILIPEYVCSSVVTAAKREGFKVKRYSITNNLKPDDSIFTNVAGSLVLLVMYFGLVDVDTDAKRLSDAGATVVVDMVQALYASPPKYANYWFGGYRKFLPVPEGAFAFSQGEELNPKGAVSFAGSIKILGGILKWASRSGELSDDNYLDYFSEGEKVYNETEDITIASQLAIILLDDQEMFAAGMRRRENALVLQSALREIGIEPLVAYRQGDPAPLVIPIAVGDRDSIREYLKSIRIFLPVHWPDIPTHGLSGFLRDHELSLVVDQRYGADDMVRIVDALRYMHARSIQYAH